MTMLERFRKPAPPPMVAPPSPPIAIPSDPLAIVTVMANLGCVFVPGRCPVSASPMLVYRAPREHSAECDRLAAAVPYSAFVAAIHQLPGSIKPEPLPPPPATAYR